MLDCPAGRDPGSLYADGIVRAINGASVFRTSVLSAQRGRVRTRRKGNRASFVQASADHLRFTPIQDN